MRPWEQDDLTLSQFHQLVAEVDEIERQVKASGST